MSCYLSERTSDTLLTMPFSSRVGNITATVLWAAEPVDSHIRVHTWTERERHTDPRTCSFPEKIQRKGQFCDNQLYLTECLQC